MPNSSARAASAEARIDQSVRRILGVKYDLGLVRNPAACPLPLAGLPAKESLTGRHSRTGSPGEHHRPQE